VRRIKKKVCWQSIADEEKIRLWKQNISRGLKTYWLSPAGILRKQVMRESFFEPVKVEYQKKIQSKKPFGDILKEFAPWKEKLIRKFSSYPAEEISQAIDIGMWKGYTKCVDKKYLTSSVTSYGYWSLLDFLEDERHPYGKLVFTPTADMDVFEDDDISIESKPLFWAAVKFVRDKLSKPGKETLDLLIKGYSQREIAEIRGVSPGRISQIITNIIRPRIAEVLSYASIM